MRSSRVWLLFGLGLLVAAVGLATPIVLKGLPQLRFQRAMESVNGSVQYDFLTHSGEEWKKWLAGWVGPAMVGTIRLVDFRYLPSEIHRDPAAMAQWLERCQGVGAIEGIFIRGESLDRNCLEQIAQLESLDQVFIDGGKIGDLAPLARLPHLRFVYIHMSTGITADTIDTLSTFPALNELDLQRTDVEGSSLARFGSFSHLSELSLYGTGVTTDDLLLLADAPALKLVQVSSDIQGGSEGLDRVRQALPKIELQQQ